MLLSVIFSLLLFIISDASAASTELKSFRGWTPVSNGNILQEGILRLLCGSDFYKCIGNKLHSAILTKNNQLMKVDTYDLKQPAITDELNDAQDTLRMDIEQLADNIEQQKAEIRHDIYSSFDELSTHLDEQSQRLKSELTEDMNQFKTALQRAVKRKFQRLQNEILSIEDPHANLPASCVEAFEKNAGAESGIYTLYLPGYDLEPFKVYCLADPNAGPAWTVVQRRIDGTEDFYRNWDDYVSGFGDMSAEFFVGLDKLHALTNYQPNELWIDMMDFEDTMRYAKYAEFAIGDEADNYALNKLGEFSGNAGDSLTVQKGQQFSTKDRDNDNDPGKSCAITYTGAWWYNHCHDSNLNGRYLYGEYDYDEDAQGIDWYTWHGHAYSLKYVHMAIRPSVNVR